MSIQTELARLTNAKTAIQTAIEGKGVTVPSGTLLDGMAALIDAIEAGGGGGISGYNIISGTYTPETDITSSFAVYTTEPLTSSSSEISKIIMACTAFSFPVIAGLDDNFSTFPCVIFNATSCSRNAACNAKGSSTSSSTVIKSCLMSAKISSSKYALRVYLACNASYPLKAARTYQWVLLIPEYI